MRNSRCESTSSTGVAWRAWVRDGGTGIRSDMRCSNTVLCASSRALFVFSTNYASIAGSIDIPSSLASSKFARDRAELITRAGITTTTVVSVPHFGVRTVSIARRRIDFMLGTSMASRPIIFRLSEW